MQVRGWTNAQAAQAMDREYAAVLELDPETATYSVTVPALSEVATWGRTIDEALKNAHDAIELSLQHRRDKGLEIPDSDKAEVRQVRVTLPAA